MTTRVLLVHYTPPGVIGGVEHIMHQHIALLRSRGFEAQVVAGRAGEAGLPVEIIPELDTARPGPARVESELNRGVVSPHFYEAREAIARQLAPLAAGADVVVVHNAFTLHFSQPLTAVLWELASRRPGSIVAWCHDLAWTNPLYIPFMHDGYPWHLLRTPAPGVTYVTVSDERRMELSELWDRPDVPILTIPNGIRPEDFLRLSPEAIEIVDRYQLFNRDMVLLLPVRITRRKNIQLGIRIVKALKDRGLDVRFLISGPQAPHHPGLSDAYLGRLENLRSELDVREEVVFLSHELGHNLSSETVGELYSVADVLLFPSSQEGFGLPILEAGLARVPVVLSDIQIFREVGGEDVWRFDLEADPDTIAGTIMSALESRPSRLYRRVLSDYRWDVIVDRQIVPLLRGPEPAPATAAQTAR